MNHKTRYLTSSQAAERLGLAEGTVKRYCQQGRLGQKIGRNWAITEAQLKRFAKKPRPVGNPTFGKKA